MTVNVKSIVEQETLRWAKSHDELRQSYTDFLGSTARYLCHPDIPVVTGSEPALELIAGFHQGFGVETIEVEWLYIVAFGNDVWNERIDHMVNAAGERFLAIPIAGRFSFDDAGTLTEWHDYWDMTQLNALAAQ